MSITIKCILITAIVGFGGWILGCLTEKVAGGSIIPTFIAHALGNFLLAMAKAYEIF